MRCGMIGSCHSLCGHQLPAQTDSWTGGAVIVNIPLPEDAENAEHENARHENVAPNDAKLQEWKMRGMKIRHQIAGVENARHENTGKRHYGTPTQPSQ